MAQSNPKAKRKYDEKLKRAQQLLGTRTEAETIECALDEVISERARNRRALLAHERFFRQALKAEIRDVYGVLED